MSRNTETTEVIMVRPPAASCTEDRDSDAAIGIDEKNEPNTFEAPRARNSLKRKFLMLTILKS